MKKLQRFLMPIVAILTVILCACSSLPTSEQEPNENLGEIQAALGACTRPTGDAGDQSAPVSAYVTGVHLGAHDYEMDVQTTYVATGATQVDTITFGVGQAKITGSGWSGAAITQVVVAASATWCDADLHQVCMKFRGPGSADGILKFDDRFGAPKASDWSTTNTGKRVAKIRGYGRWTAQTLKLYNELDDGSVFTRQWQFEGATLDACSDPY